MESKCSYRNMEAFWENWERFFGELSSFLGTAKRAEYPSKDYCEYVVQRLELWIVSVSHLLHHIQSAQDQEVIAGQGPVGSGDGQSDILFHVCTHMMELIENLRAVLSRWNNYLEHYDVLDHSQSYRSPVEAEHVTAGRPRYVITKEQLEYLRSMSFSWVKISELLGVSYMTVYRRRKEYGIVDTRGRDISDRDVEQIVSEIRHEQPAIGQTMVWARIR